MMPLDPCMKNIGKNAVFFREQAGLNRSEVQRMTGVDPSALAKIEKGTSNPGVGTILALCKAYGVGMEEFLFRDPDSGKQVAEFQARQQGKSALQDILLVAHMRAVADKKVFILPEKDEVLEITVERKKHQCLNT